MIATVTLHPCIDKTFSVDRVIPDRKLTGYDVRSYPGGGGLNAARVISRLDGAPRALWTSAERPNAEALAEMLDAENLDHAPLPVAGDVRENLIVTDESTGEQYRFGTPGPALSGRERASWLDHLRSHAASASYVVFSGSLPPETPPAWYGELIDVVAGSSRVVVDTKAQGLRAALEIGVYLIKPNAGELADLLGRELASDSEIEEAATALVKRGAAEVVLVSLGRGGAILTTARGSERLAAPSVRMRSKVGAGDSLVGATVWALDNDRPIEDAARYGVAAGAAAVITAGTELCRAEDVERLYRQMARRGER